MVTQLTMNDREVISQMRYAGESQAAIARRLRRHKRTIGRELARKSSGDDYSAVAAQEQAADRRRCRPLMGPMGTSVR